VSFIIVSFVDSHHINIAFCQVVSSEHSPKKLVIRLCAWVHGIPLSSTKYFPLEVLVDAGTYLGRMCHALDDLAASNPAALELSKTYHAWDGRNLVDAMRYVEHIDDPQRRKLVTSVIDTFRQVIIDGGEGKKFRWGVNHGDFNDANIIVSDDDSTGTRVAGAIDFGDTIYRYVFCPVNTAPAR
jgi:Ser/Thr protein kinase RdoA (MazF antagonist)